MTNVAWTPVRGVITICMHCENNAPYGAKFCGDCKTADSREANHKGNREIFGPDWKCKAPMCRKKENP